MYLNGLHSELTEPDTKHLNAAVFEIKESASVVNSDEIKAWKQWSHPEFTSILSQLTQFNHIRLAAYRTAFKLRFMQKKLKLHLVKLTPLRTLLETISLLKDRAESLSTLEMMTVLRLIYCTEPEMDMLSELTAFYLSSCFDLHRSEGVQALSFKIGLVLMCSGSLNDKFEYLFSLISEKNDAATPGNLAHLFRECMKVLAQLHEGDAFDSSNIKLAVESCMEQAKSKNSVSLSELMSWVDLGPQNFIWLHVFQRVSNAESVEHRQTCDTCSQGRPILGLRFRCLHCLNFNMCQECFLSGRQSKRHRLTHPMHEYSWQSSTTEEFQDYARAFKNCVKLKGSRTQIMGSGYMPLRTPKQNYNDICEPFQSTTDPCNIYDEISYRRHRI